MEDRVPAEVFPPGEYLRDELEARGWTQTEFAQILGRPIPAVNEIINAKRAVTPTTAKEIAAALGTSAMMWLNLEAAYQLHNTEPAPKRIAVEATLRDKYPVRTLVRRGWVEPSENPEVLQARVFDFFDVDSPEDEPRFLHAARKGLVGSITDDVTMEQLAWLFRVKKLAEAMPVPKYSPSKLKGGLEKLRNLLGEPEEVRHVPKILEECGIRFVIVEHLPGSKIDGVAFWLNDWAPVVGLSLRLDRIDNFWFVLRHELEHVLRRDAALDSDLYSNEEDLSDQEREANAAAAEFCVPQAELDDFIIRVKPVFSERRVVAFARSLGRHPGLVVGQLQYRRDRYSLLRKYLVSVGDFITPYAMTDGYGRAVPV